jgi:hypothetical protein
MPSVRSAKWHAHTDSVRGVVGDSDHRQNPGMARPIGWLSFPMIVEGLRFLLSTMAPTLRTDARARRRVNATCASLTGSNMYMCRHGIGLGEAEPFGTPREPNWVSATLGPAHNSAGARQRRLQIGPT